MKVEFKQGTRVVSLNVKDSTSIHYLTQWILKANPNKKIKVK